jgi:AcrR family transcriptional regulator
MRALAQKGPYSLKAEPLARDLNTTKGSFYWHFADVPAFHKSVIQNWGEKANEKLFQQIETADTQTAALRGLAQEIAIPKRRCVYAKAEPAMRNWALDNRQAAKAVASIDTARLDLIGTLLDKIGVSNDEIAHIILSAANGLPRSVPGDPIGTLVDLVLALR